MSDPPLPEMLEWRTQSGAVTGAPWHLQRTLPARDGALRVPYGVIAWRRPHEQEWHELTELSQFQRKDGAT